jgi:hypothetical protein
LIIKRQKDEKVRKHSDVYYRDYLWHWKGLRIKSRQRRRNHCRAGSAWQHKKTVKELEHWNPTHTCWQSNGLVEKPSMKMNLLHWAWRDEMS